MAQHSTRFSLLAVVVTLMVGSGAAASAAESTKGDAPLATATFAGGCFWCMEPPFDALPGVVSTTSGYTGGTKRGPHLRGGLRRKHRPRRGGAGGLRPAPGQLRAAARGLLAQRGPARRRPGSSATRGTQYRSAIFVQDAEQRRLAEESKLALREVEALRAAARDADRPRLGRSTRPRSTTRTTTGRTRCAIASTAPPVVAIRA